MALKLGWHYIISWYLVGIPLDDAELASLTAGLAVGKPGSSFSLVTDSALGRSTAAASVTTAGVTHDSEVHIHLANFDYVI